METAQDWAEFRRTMKRVSASVARGNLKPLLRVLPKLLAIEAERDLDDRKAFRRYGWRACVIATGRVYLLRAARTAWYREQREKKRLAKLANGG